MESGLPDYMLGSHGYTYSAHPVACAAGLASLEILESEQLPERVNNLAPHFSNSIHSLRDISCVKDIRNFGFAGALTLDAYPGEPARRPFEIAMRMWEKGFYIRYGGDTLQLGLPFVIETSEIDLLISALADALKEN